MKGLATLGALGAQAKGDPRIDLARAAAAASLGDDRLRRDAADLAAQEAGERGATLLVARARTTECRALANLGENEKAQTACEEARQIYAAAGDRGALAQTLIPYWRATSRKFPNEIASPEVKIDPHPIAPSPQC